MTLELEIKIGLEKLEATELTCEEAPCKQCIFSKLLAPSRDIKQITEENRSKLFSFTCEKCMLQELGLNRQKYCLLFIIIIKSYWEEDLRLLNILPTITRPWMLVCMYMRGEGVIYALLSKPKKHKIITSYRVSSPTPSIWGRGLRSLRYRGEMTWLLIYNHFISELRQEPGLLQREQLPAHPSSCSSCFLE